MSKLLYELRVKPSISYGRERRVLLVAITLDGYLTPVKSSRLQMEYPDKRVVCYNPQNLRFSLNKVISAIRTIHGQETSMEVVDNA